jgi:hypothetical protein
MNGLPFTRRRPEAGQDRPGRPGWILRMPTRVSVQHCWPPPTAPGCTPRSPCAWGPEPAPRKPWRCAGSTSRSAIRPLRRPCRPAQRCGVWSEPTGIPQDRQVAQDAGACRSLAAEPLRVHQTRLFEERRAAGAQLNDHDLVFATRTGRALDAANIRREFRAVCKAAKIGEYWTPRELRHSCVALMSSSGVPVEEIARLAGHSSTRTTAVVYRRELRPVLTTGAEAMDRLLSVRAF